jgi:hypothetical protein
MVAQGKGGKIIGACSIAGHRPVGIIMIIDRGEASDMLT